MAQGYGMNWKEERKRIRRFLRDPDGNIWSDGFLRRIYNDSQRNINMKTDYLEDVRTVSIPPKFGMSYMFDWEWTYATEQSHQCLKLHQQSDTVYSYVWEPQTQWGLIDTVATDVGHHWTHPWAAWYSDRGDPVPFRLPKGFKKARYATWNRKPLEYIDFKLITGDDPSWNLQEGETFAYYRKDLLDQTFHLYPLNVSDNWNDVERDGDLESMVLHDDESTISAETGTIVDKSDSMSPGELGIVLDIIPIDNNVMFAFTKEPTDIETDTDEGSFPAWMRKYVQHGTLEKAFEANNDGNIPSLSQYWRMRKELGIAFIQEFKQLREVDRDYRLTTKINVGRRNRRGPRLPDTYPAMP